jgi:archaellum component FlaC
MIREAGQKTREYLEKVETAFANKSKTKGETEHIEDTERLVTEIKMLKVVLYLVSRSRN